MFKKIRLFINKETSSSRVLEIFKWIIIVCIFDVFLFFILNNLDYIFEKKILNLLQIMVAIILFFSTVALLLMHTDIYKYLYNTHPYTIKLKKERDMEIAQKNEEAREKQQFLEAEAMKKQQKLDEEAAKLRVIQEKKKRKEREKTKRLDILIKEALRKENAHESLKNFLILRDLYYNNLDNHGKGEWLEVRAKELKDEEEALNNSPLTNYFGAVEGGETVLYYLKLENKFGETRYKIGVTLNSVEKRYAGKSSYKILYEKKLTHANTIEKKILEKFNHLVTDESLLGTNGTEIFKEDVLKLDI